jgi:hypothetical protein
LRANILQGLGAASVHTGKNSIHVGQPPGKPSESYQQIGVALFFSVAILVLNVQLPLYRKTLSPYGAHPI